MYIYFSGFYIVKFWLFKGCFFEIWVFLKQFKYRGRFKFYFLIGEKQLVVSENGREGLRFEVFVVRCDWWVYQVVKRKVVELFFGV